MRAIIAFLVAVSARPHIDMLTTLDHVPVITDGIVEENWSISPPLKPACGEISQFLETDFIQIRDFELTYLRGKAQEITLSLSVQSETLQTTVFPGQVTIQRGNTVTVAVEYHCDDFTEGVHTVDIFVAHMKNTFLIRYGKVCGRPKETNFDYSYIATTGWGAVLIAMAPLVPSSEGQWTYSLHLTGKVVVKLVLLSIVVGLAGWLMTAFLAVSFVFAWVCIYLFTRTTLLNVSCLQRDFPFPYVGRVKAGEILIGAIVWVLVAVWFLQHNWLLSNICASVLFISVTKLIKVDCFRCCTGLCYVAFLCDIIRVFYLGSAAEWGSAAAAQWFSIHCPRLAPVVSIRNCAEFSLASALLPALVLETARRQDAKTECSCYYWWMLAAYILSLVGTSVLYWATGQLLPWSFLTVPAFLLFTAVVSSTKADLQSLWSPPV